MSSTVKNGRVVQAGLLVFGIPFIVAISALAFQAELPTYVAANADIIAAVAAVGAIGVLLTVLLAWLADRRCVSRLNETIKEMEAHLALKDSDFVAKAEQHALELGMKQQQLDQQKELLTQEAKIAILEKELTIRELKLAAFQAGQTKPEPLKAATAEVKGDKVTARKDPMRTLTGSDDVKANPASVSEDPKSVAPQGKSSA